MIRKSRRCWSKSIGEPGHRVRLYEARPGGSIMRSVFTNGEETLLRSYQQPDAETVKRVVWHPTQRIVSGFEGSAMRAQSLLAIAALTACMECSILFAQDSLTLTASQRARIRKAEVARGIDSTDVPHSLELAGFVAQTIWKGFDTRSFGTLDAENSQYAQYLGEHLTAWLARVRQNGWQTQCRTLSSRRRICAYTVSGTSALGSNWVSVAAVFDDSVAETVGVSYLVASIEGALIRGGQPSELDELDGDTNRWLTLIYGTPRDSVAAMKRFKIWRTPRSIVVRELREQAQGRYLDAVSWEWRSRMERR